MTHRRQKLLSVLLFAAGSLTMSGCDQVTGAAEVAKALAEGKATGAACRHAGRGIEDCYSLNPNTARAAIFQGWKEMNDYMRENNIANVKPDLPPPPAPAAAEH